MTVLELFVLSLGLAMDASAVAICKGACMRGFNLKEAGLIAIFFGVFQAVMPLIGWFLGSQFIAYIQQLDHWIAMILLMILGLRMIWEAIHEEEELVCTALDLRELLVLSVATSIDALAAGIALAVLNTNIISSVIVIGLVTAALSLGGVVIGSRFGKKYQSKAQIVGGVVLCLIGMKILIEHLSA